MSGALTVLLLAGQREGRPDPFAEAAGVRFKALAPVAGRPMITYALDALAACPRVSRIIISINAGAGLDRIPAIAALAASGRVQIVDARTNLVDSVLTALEGVAFPVLITTADNVLTSPAGVAEIDDRARAGNADIAVAMARREAVLAAHPDGQRRFYKFSDGEFSNCNSYWIGHPKALAPAELFRTGGQFVKHPMRVVSALGLAGIIELIRFRFGLGGLEAGFRRLSKHFKLTIRPVVVTDGALAIDVDHERSRRVAEEVLAARAAGARIAAE